MTIRGWEREGLIALPRDSGENRKLTIDDLRSAAQLARKLGRISKGRLRLIEATIFLMEQVEEENGK